MTLTDAIIIFSVIAFGKFWVFDLAGLLPRVLLPSLVQADEKESLYI